MTGPQDASELAKQLAAAMSPQQQRAFLDAILSAGSAGVLEAALLPAAPEAGQVPARVRGFQVRLDLLGTTPPVWRRLELPGDLPLERLHLVIQAAMGWTESHLHRFRTGADRRSPSFVTPFDVEEGDDGVLEDGVRLDQLVTTAGDGLWYEYDFGDGWDHRLRVEEVRDDPPPRVWCTAGRRECPPEDCGGVGGYAELAAWVRGGCDPAAVPEPFDDAEQVWEWLPLDWHPDHFDLDEVNAALAVQLTSPTVPDELAELRDALEARGNRMLSVLLARTAALDAPPLGEADAALLLEPFEVLLDVVGDGVRLTAAGYLPPAVVETLAERTGVARWWIGKANREDLTPPIAQLRDAARAFGLVSVRKGMLAPTAAARRLHGRPLELWRQVASRLPLGKAPFDRQAGWMTLAVIGSEAPPAERDTEIRDLLLALGWRSGSDIARHDIPIWNSTLRAFEVFGGLGRRDKPPQLAAALAATARAAVLRDLGSS